MILFKRALALFTFLILILLLLISFTDTVETFIAKRLVDSSDEQHEITIQFDSFDYTPPNQIKISGYEILAPQGRLSGLTIETSIEEVDVNHLTLGTLHFTAPVVHAYNTEESAPTKQQETSQHKGFKVFFDEVNINGGTLRYSPEKTEQFAEIANIEGKIERLSKGNDNNDIFSISAQSTQGKEHRIQFEGNLNLATMKLDSVISNAELALNDSTFTKNWPTSWLDTIKDLNISRKLQLTTEGIIDFQNIKGSNLKGGFSTGGFKLPVEDINLQISQSNTQYRLDKGHFFFDTQLETQKDAVLILSKGDIALNHAHLLFRNDWELSGFDIGQLFPDKKDIAGIMDSKGTIIGTLKNFKVGEGNGSFKIKSGKFINLPVITQLSSLLNIENLIRGRIEQNDTMVAKFVLSPDRVEFSKIDVHNVLLAARMKGDIYYDGSLDMVANAGPIEKVEIILGPIGELTSAVKRNISAYEIAGKVTAPKVRKTILGVGF